MAKRKWSPLRRQHFEAKKALAANKPLGLTQEQPQQNLTPSVDIRRLEENAYRRGLVDAVSVILRELR